MALAALSLLLLLTTAFALSDPTPSAEAQDSETTALIGYFNQYRASHGAGSLSPSINSYAQSQAQQAVDDCGYTYKLGGHNAIWGHYGYSTAEPLWNAYLSDPSHYYLDKIANPIYHSVGVGRVKVPPSSGCHDWNWLWVVVLDKAGGGGTTAPTTHTPSPTPSRTPSPTPSTSGVPTPTATPTGTPTTSPSGTATSPPLCDVLPPETPAPGCVGTPTPTETPSETPTPTAQPEMPGDADCDLDVDSEDGILLLFLAANLAADAPCLGFDGVNCQGLIDITDVLAILSFVGDIPFELPADCPPLGTILTPSPSPIPTDTPVPTDTLVPTPTQTPTPPASTTSTPGVTPIADGVHHCILALVSYQIDTGQVEGHVRCTPTVGTSYDCYFSAVNAACTASSNGFPDYVCSFATGYADCAPNVGEPEYQCFVNAPGAVECLPTHVGYPAYNCDIADGVVTCTSALPFPDFACTKQAVDLDCVATAIGR